MSTFLSNINHSLARDGLIYDTDVNILEKSERFLNFLMTDYESNGITKQFNMIVIDNYFDKLLIT
tara:strand:+ start:275 stop:469 length:195 start_codon:yes stop_codon:yes gene_type:complete